MGISIASRWPVESVQELDLHITPRTGDFPCGTLLAEVLVPDPIGPLLFVNHFPSWQLDFEYERELQAVLAARVIEERARQSRLHVLLGGDLDADPDATSIRFWCGRHSLDGISVCYRDAWESLHPQEPGHTFTEPAHGCGELGLAIPAHRLPLRALWGAWRTHPQDHLLPAYL